MKETPDTDTYSKEEGLQKLQDMSEKTGLVPFKTENMKLTKEEILIIMYCGLIINNYEKGDELSTKDNIECLKRVIVYPTT